MVDNYEERNMAALNEKPIILASQSIGRSALLEGANIVFEKKPAPVDECAIRDSLYANGAKPDPKDVAEILARAKAELISKENLGVYVIGADQMLALGQRIFEKPKDMDDARKTLLALNGQTHYLHSAICVALDGETVWSTVSSAAMTMRSFSPEFLGHYLAGAGESVLTSVGAYRLEETGIHLFDKIEGDYFTILGLPILPLLDYFRSIKILET